MMQGENTVSDENFLAPPIFHNRISPGQGNRVEIRDLKLVSRLQTLLQEIITVVCRKIRWILQTNDVGDSFLAGF